MITPQSAVKIQFVDETTTLFVRRALFPVNYVGQFDVGAATFSLTGYSPTLLTDDAYIQAACSNSLPYCDLELYTPDLPVCWTRVNDLVIAGCPSLTELRDLIWELLQLKDESMPQTAMDCC